MTNSLLGHKDGSSFCLISDETFFTIDTGAGLIFKIRRLDYGSHTQSPGDIASLTYNGIEYQDQNRGTQINSGFDYLYNGISAVSVEADQIDNDHIKITVTAGNLTHYYLSKRGDARIYMGTTFSSEPDVHGLVRYIVRAVHDKLPNGPIPSNILGNTGAIESGDIFSMADGQTRSKHYSNQRLKDWSYIGATGNNVGLWIVKGNSEGMSGGPFYRSLLNQGASDQEITYIVNYGEAQTEGYRFNILNLYTLVFTDSSVPPLVDTGWLSQMELKNWLGPEGRGNVAGVGLKGMDKAFAYTVGFTNSSAMYWSTANSSDGKFSNYGMLPGDYDMNVYKNELAVASEKVTVVAGQTLPLHTIAVTNDPSFDTSLWRIGDWDGTPTEFLNGDKITTMHPSDIRMSPWTVNTFVIGVSQPETSFPAYQWRDINNSLKISFNLSAEQIADYRLRIGVTISYIGGRPQVHINNWSASGDTPSQPKTRSLTVGTYRGNNTMYTFIVPASALNEGQNILIIDVISGSSGSRWLSPGFAYDAIDFTRI